MDNIGGHVNPLHLVQQLPAGMEIPGLRDRLARSSVDSAVPCCMRLCVPLDCQDLTSTPKPGDGVPA